MRAAPLPVVPPAVTFSLTYLAEVAVMLWVVLLAVFAVTVAAVVHVVPLVDVWMLKSRVFQPASSPPAPACCTTNRLTDCAEPRSTWSHLLVPSEHHLSALPPLTVPLKA